MQGWHQGKESTNMSSIPGLPALGSEVVVLITRVNLNPLCPLVELWGNFNQERKADYQYLSKDIQYKQTTNKLNEFEGNPGDQCLVQVDETWYRSRIVSRNGSNYKCFLIDKGWTLTATTSMLAWGKKEFFHLPPEVEFCVLANVLPLSHESKWSPMALEFLKTLNWKTVKAHVQDVMVPQRTIVLQIPSIAPQMYEMGFAKKLSPKMFSDFLLKSLQPPSSVALATELHQESMRNEPPGIGQSMRNDPPGIGLSTPNQQRFMYPELQMGTVETVIVTEVTNPMRVFCQLKVFAQELKKVTEQITLYYEGRFTPCIVTSNMLGFPCAARGSDGRWYRSVLQQILPGNNVVEVLNVDYGKKQLVQVENIRPLAAEFFRMPVVTYVCSLHGVTDKGLGWTAAQIEYLKSLILYKTVIAKFEYQSLCEGVHYVTLYGDEKTSINSLFGSQEKCLLECEKSLLNFDVRSTPSRPQHSAQRESQGIVPVEASKDTEGENIQKLLTADLSLNSSHVAVVHHVSSPFEFWIQSQKYADEFDELMENIDSLYSDLATTNLIRNPTVGLYCAAKAQDDTFYRATVTEVSKTQVKVFFGDYGNTELIDRDCIRVLPEKYKELPQLALKCRLAGIKPKDETWSRSAIDLFIKAVMDKVLNVHVTAKCDGAYIVQIADSTAHGEQDVNKLMCNSGLAENDVSQKRPNVKRTTSPVVCPVKSKLAALPVRGNEKSEIPSQTPNLIESGPATFNELMFPIGTAVDVSVSYIESPNDFWCQLCQNKGQLNLLMQEMQMFYAKSHFQPFTESVCVARHPHNGMWYRALVLSRDTTQHVDVLFVDYGQRKRVPLLELRKINPSFLNLKGQAFRCSLYNPVKPTSPMNDWDEVAIAEFQHFVDAAASSHVILKCTIYAVMYNEQNVVFNIVDLETPFESACTRMVHHATIASLSKEPASSLHLDTYYYSTHNIKTGTEEKVTVTCVSNVNKFYCQLERNADIVKDLQLKVNGLCHKLKSSKLSTTFGMLCFAKYPDGKWYRGQIKAVQPSIRVHFVDYGDTLNVDPSDLLPIPREASDIISVPVQAIECGLSDISANVPNDVNGWFETNATEQSFRALVVAKQPDGKLQVELYHGKTQINATIKQRFHIDEPMWQHGNVIHHVRSTPKFTSNAQHLPTAVSEPTTKMEGTQATKTNQSAPKVRSATLEHYRTPQQRQLDGRSQSSMQDCSEPVGANNRHIEQNLSSEQKCSEESKLPSSESQKKSYASLQPEVETLPKLTDLPTNSIEVGMEADVFVSHSNSPLSFYVQLACDEADICSIVSKLNDGEPSTKTIKDLQLGDLVQAEFPDDDSWYRAVVREISDNKMALVEFVDFGNSCEVSVDNIFKLNKSLLQCPAYSTQCLLSGAAVLQKESELDPKLVSSFQKSISTDGEKVFKCFFIRQSGSIWEVNLEDGGVDIMCTMSTSIPDDSSVAHEPLEESSVQKDEECTISVCIEPQEELGTEAGLSELTSSLEASERFDAAVKPVFIADARKDHGDQTNDLGAPKLDKEGLPKLTDLPSQSITAGMEADIFVLHCNNPLSFYVHLVEEQADLISIVDKLNDGESSAESGNIEDLHPGDLILAEFPDDNSWYRAVVRDIHANETALVEFVDYGNTAVVSISKMCTLSKPFLQFPRYSAHCVLSGAAAIKKELVLDPEVVSSFEEEVGPSTDKVLKCVFIRQSESVWEVSLEDSGVEITCKISTGSPTPYDDVTPKMSEVDGKPCQEDELMTDQQVEHVVPEAADVVETDQQEEHVVPEAADVVEICIKAFPESAESAPTTKADLGAQEEEVIVAEGVQTVDLELESVPEEPETHTEGNDAAAILESEFGPLRAVPEEPKTHTEDTEGNDSAAILESEFGPLTAAKNITVGSSCVVWSPVVKSWCKARVLKNTSDCILVLLIVCDTQMEVEPCSVFELVSSGHEECDNAGSSDYATTSSHVIASEPNPVQSESPQSENVFDASAEQDVETEDFESPQSENVFDASAEQDVETEDFEEALSVVTPHKDLVAYDMSDNEECDDDDSTDTVSNPESSEEDTLDEQSDTSEDTIDYNDLVDTDTPEEMVQTELPQSPCVPLETFIDPPAEQGVETEDVTEEAQSVGTHDRSDLIEEETRRDDDDQSSAIFTTALLAETEPATCEPQDHTDPCLNMDDVNLEATCPNKDCSDLLPEAEMEPSEQHADTASTENTDLVEEASKEESSGSPNNSLEAQLSMVTHLCLVVEDEPDDIVVFEKGIDHPAQQQQDMRM